MDTGTIVALLLSGLGLVITAGDKIFGGGTALARQFHKLDKDTTAEMATLRREVMQKIDDTDRISTVGFDAIKSNIHELQMATLEFRAKMAETLHSYIHKDDYNAGIEAVKRDVRDGFRSVDEQLGRLQDLIMHVNPDLVPPQKRKGAHE